MEKSYPDDKTRKKGSKDSTHSNASVENYEAPRKSRTGLFGDNAVLVGNLKKSRQSFGAYTSLFARKLLPPLGFYRESQKYADLKKRFVDDPFKLDALDEMWHDYKKYQIRKRFRWPPQLFFKKFFWTTGYYADYQKIHHATKLRKPGEDSSEEEFIDPAGQFMVVGGDNDINIDEFNRYRAAKKAGRFGALAGPRKTRFGDIEYEGPKTEQIEVETTVEYEIIKAPRKNKKDKKKKKGDKRTSEELIPKDATVDGFSLSELKSGQKVVTKRKSIAVEMDGKRTEKVLDESSEVVAGKKEKKKGWW